MTAAVADFSAPIGALVEIERHAESPVAAEVIGFRDKLTIVYPLESMSGIRRGNHVRLIRTSRSLRVGDGLLGRVINAHGKCIDARPQPLLVDRTRLDRSPPRALERPRIDTQLSTGIRALDAMLTCGRGQRLGIMAGSGVGKSVLLGMMSRYTSADAIVIGLIGERGREVNEFIERDLGPEGLSRSVVVVATSDEPALLRLQAAYAATSVAEYFRDQGRDVLLLMDSVTRFAMALREISLAAGEPPTTRGYPPSMFSTLPQLVERVGRTDRGSITAFYSVLVEGDDASEPVADTMRGLLDGHVWLSRSLASRGHYPAIDILESLSRLMNDVTKPEQREAAKVIRELLAIHRAHEDLLSVGAYRKGANHRLDVAVEMQKEIGQFLHQEMGERANTDASISTLVSLSEKAKAKLAAQAA